MYLIFNQEPIALYLCFYPKLIMPEACSVISNLEIIKFVLYEIIKEWVQIIGSWSWLAALYLLNQILKFAWETTYTASLSLRTSQSCLVRFWENHHLEFFVSSYQSKQSCIQTCLNWEIATYNMNFFIFIQRTSWLVIT